MPKPTGVPNRFHVVIPATDLPSPQATNWAHISQAAGTVQLLLGYIDPGEVKRVVDVHRKGRSEERLRPECTHRIAMSVHAFVQLRSQVEEMFATLRGRGEVAGDAPEEGISNV